MMEQHLMPERKILKMGVIILNTGNQKMPILQQMNLL